MLESSGSIVFTLRKHAYSNILKISPPKTESFQIKVLISFIFAEVVLTSTHNLCFGAEIKKKTVLLYKSGVLGGQNYIGMFS